MLLHLLGVLAVCRYASHNISTLNHSFHDWRFCNYFYCNDVEFLSEVINILAISFIFAELMHRSTSNCLSYSTPVWFLET